MSGISVSRFIVKAISPYKGYLAGIICTAIIWALNLSLRPYLLKAILNSANTAVTAADFYWLWILVIVYNLRSVFHSCIFSMYDWVSLNFSAQLRKRLGLLLMEQMLSHTTTYYQNCFVGDLANKMQDVTNGVPVIVKKIIERYVSHLIAFVIAVGMLVFVQIKFAVAMLIWIVSLLLLLFKAATRTKELSGQAAQTRSTVVGHMVDSMSNMPSIRLFARRQSEFLYIDNSLENLVGAETKRDWFFLKINVIERIAYLIFQTLCIWWLVDGLQKGTLTPGDFALVLTLNLSIGDCLWGMAEDARKLIEDFGNVSQALSVIMQPAGIIDAVDAKELVVTRGEIVFDNVQFMYRGLSPIFQNKSIVIPAGQKVGLVGYSGSGKSTFVNLILRLFDVQFGRILIDGQDITKVTQDSLHQAISMIPQEPSLFQRTVMENIRYGKLDASDEEIVQAARQACAHDFIVTFEDGYNTLVGERGSKLSGGQRQRIAIARAILKNAPLLMLDEATSQLDYATESAIQESLWKLMQGKTTLVIAHRLSTLENMDRILVFEKGVIVQDGTHDQLISVDGLYRTLRSTQVGGFLNDRVHTAE